MPTAVSTRSEEKRGSSLPVGERGAEPSTWGFCNTDLLYLCIHPPMSSREFHSSEIRGVRIVVRFRVGPGGLGDLHGWIRGCMAIQRLADLH